MYSLSERVGIYSHSIDISTKAHSHSPCNDCNHGDGVKKSAGVFCRPYAVPYGVPKGSKVPTLLKQGLRPCSSKKFPARAAKFLLGQDLIPGQAGNFLLEQGFSCSTRVFSCSGRIFLARAGFFLLDQGLFLVYSCFKINQ